MKFIKNAISVKNKPETPPPVISYSGIPILSTGGLCQLTGKQKTGKTGILMSIIAGCFADTDTFGLTISSCPSDKYVMYFNTELSYEDLYEFYLSVLNRIDSNEDLPNLVFVDLKPHILSSSKVKQLKEIVKDAENIHLLIIDGIVDLCNDFNSIPESTKTLEFINEIIVNYECPIITTLHQNPNSNADSKSRGHLGTFLSQKVNSTMITKKTKSGDKENFYLTLTDLRKGFIANDIPFQFNKELGYHTSLGSLNIKEFMNTTRSSEELKTFIQTVSKVGRNKALDIIKDYEDRGIIRKENDSRKAKYVLQ
jgi:RecA-family ATPase